MYYGLYRVTAKSTPTNCGDTNFLVLGDSDADVLDAIYRYVCCKHISSQNFDNLVEYTDIPYYLRPSNLTIEYIGAIDVPTQPTHIRDYILASYKQLP